MEGARDYAEYVRSRLTPALARFAGFSGVYLLRRLEEGTLTHLVVLSLWESTDAMSAFAGDDLSRAVVEPEAAAMLLDFDESVRLYEVVTSAGPSDQTSGQ
jgi:heme-degrading monooxygenase HmoA